jgi:hypothetical protein
MSERYEFCSPGWVAAVRRLVAASAIAEDDLRGIDWSFCEEFTDPPIHLLLDGEKTIGWSMRIRAGSIEIVDGPIDDAQARVVADYATVLLIARLEFLDEASIGRGNELIAQATAEGKLRLEGDPLARPAVMEKRNLHNALAPLTA